MLKHFIEQMVDHFSYELEGHFEQKYDLDEKPGWIFYYCWVRGDGKRKITMRATDRSLISSRYRNECYSRYVIPWLAYCDIPYNVDYTEDDDPNPGNEAEAPASTLSNVVTFRRK